MKKSISKKITLTVCLLLITLNLVVSFVGYVKNNKEEEKRFDQRALYITEIASQSGTNLLWDFEYNKLALFSRYILEDPLLSGVLFISKVSGGNEPGHIVGFIRGKGTIDEEIVDLESYFPEFYDDTSQVDLVWGDEKIGELLVFFDRRELHAYQDQRMWADLVRKSLIFLIFLIAIYLVLQTQFVMPFKRSHELAKALTEKFNQLIKENKQLAETVRAQHREINRHVTELKRLEKESPGITQVDWGEDGSIDLTDEY